MPSPDLMMWNAFLDQVLPWIEAALVVLTLVGAALGLTKKPPTP